MKSSELKEGDYNPYYKTYIDKLGDSELLETLEKQLENFPNFMASIPEEKLQYAYAPEKWTVLEALQHIIDTERVFQYRALRFSRNDQTPLMGFDQDDFVPASNANKKSIEDIIEEAEVGKIYTGKVKRIADFGAFVGILPKTDGLVHISQLANERVEKVEDVVKEGDEVKVKVIDIDRQGRVRLSMKEVEQSAPA